MRPLVIGVGNRWRGDDGLGPRVLDALAERATGVVDLIALDGEPARLVAAWTGRSHVIVVDAVRSGDPSGTIHWVDALDLGLTGRSSPSSHGAGVAAAVAIGRALDRLPHRLVVVGIEPESVEHGDELSAPVAAAFDELVALVVEEMAITCA